MMTKQKKDTNKASGDGNDFDDEKTEEIKIIKKPDTKKDALRT